MNNKLYKFEKIQQRFCKKCGTPLQSEVVNASKYPVSVSGYPLIRTSNDAFDSITGKEQFMRRYFCPNKGLFNWFTYAHDDFGSGGMFTEDGYLGLDIAKPRKNFGKWGTPMPPVRSKKKGKKK